MKPYPDAQKLHLEEGHSASRNCSEPTYLYENQEFVVLVSDLLMEFGDVH